jgi:eukaryotic-like serine/threonine-protein kinase
MADSSARPSILDHFGLRPQGGATSWWLALVLLPFLNLMVGRALFGIGFVLLLHVAAESQNQPGTGSWPMFRGNSRLWGVSETPLPASLKLRWTYQAKESIESSAAIVDGVAYVGSTDGTLHAVDLASGKARWEYKTKGPVAESSPCVQNGTVFVGDLDGVFHAVDANTGKPRWTFQSESEIKSSPNWHDNRVYFGSYDQNLYCLSAADGKLIWKFTTDGPVHCTPSIDEGRIFVAGCDEVFRAVDVVNGKELFTLPIHAYMGASPAIRDGQVYVGTFGNEVIGIDLKKRALLWTYRHPVRNFPFYSSAAVTKDRVVLGGRDKILHCLNRLTGKEVWTFTTRARIESSPLIAGNRVYVGSNDGHLYVLDLASGKKIWDFTAGAPLSASPAASSGLLVIGSQDGALYCFSGP